METTETEVTMQAPAPQPQLILDAEAQSYLKEAGKWARFLAIMGFIFCGLILIFALFIGTFFSIMSKISPVYNSMPQGVGGVVSVVYILIDVLYFFFPLYLMQFSDKIKKGVVFSDSRYITAGIEKLKSFFKLWGIVTIVVLSFYALVIVFIVIVGVGASAMH